MKVIKRRDNFPIFYAEAKDFECRAAITNRAAHKGGAPRAPSFLAKARREWDAHVMAGLTLKEREFLPIVLKTGETAGYGSWTFVALGLVQKGLLAQTPEGRFRLSREGQAVAQKLVR